MTRALPLLVILAGSCAFGAVAIGAEAVVTPVPDRRALALDLLHDGRFDEADELLSESGPGGTHPSLFFFRAFVSYWRVLYDTRNPELLEEFERRILAAVEAGENRQKEVPSDETATLWTGSSRLLLAQLRASQRKPFGAAFEARRARKQLYAAVTDDVSADADFGLGTYNYMADRIPAFLKGIRALLFLPGGNRERGLEQLERAAAESRFFALEARVLLATIHSNRHERNYPEALRQAERALADFPDAVAALHAASVIDLSLGRPTHAIVHLDRALDKTRAHPRTDPAVVGTLIRLRAQADFDLFRPDLCRERLRTILEAKDAFPEVVVDAARGLDSAAAILTTSAPASPGEANGDAVSSWHLAIPALELERNGRDEESLSTILRVAATTPDDPVIALFAGRALVRAGRGSEGLEMLRRADKAKVLPDAWVGPCRLLAGQAADLAGERSVATRYYDRALDGPPFHARDAADSYLLEPYRGTP